VSDAAAAAERACRVARLADIPDGGLLAAILPDGRRLCLARRGDTVWALADRCPHADFPLSQGELLPDGSVECAWHGARFDPRDGRALHGPATDAVPTYPVLIHDGDVHVRSDRDAR
jgi:3-phenylpropionate/trans-cinnamate dioxygenase ferredoxin subunit